MRLLGYALAASGVLLGARGAASQESVPQGVRVAEIRFGVVEPPVVAYRDIMVRTPVSNQQLQAKPIECSGLAWVPGHLLILSDRHGHVVFSCPVDLDRMTLGSPTPHVVVRNEQQLLEDAECMTVICGPDGRRVVYAMCSMSNDPCDQSLPKRRHMLRFELADGESPGPQRPVVLSVTALREAVGDCFKTVGIEPYRTFNVNAPGSDKNTYRWGNVEGMAFTPDGSALLLGMRNPLCGDCAILVAVRGVAEAFDSGDPSKMRVDDVFALDLAGRGVSDLCWDPLTKGYLIAAARSNGPRLDEDKPFPPNTLDSALFWWSGRKTEKAILFAKLPDMTVEAICRLGATRFIAVGTDEGDVSEGRLRQQQSVVTIIYFAGLDRASGGREAP
jgi:hypothetical protein